MALIGRFFVVLFAYFLASLAAGAVIVFGAVSFPAADMPAHGAAWPLIWVLVFTTSSFVASIAFVPALVAILLTESFAWRSALLYALAGGAIGLIGGYSFGFLEQAPRFRLDTPLGTNFELMAAAGIAASQHTTHHV